MKRQSIRIVGVLSLAALLSTHGSAQAQPAPASSAPEGADAKFREGNALYKQHKYAEAKAAFEQAFREKPAHDIAANLGYAEIKLGLFREAAEHLAVAVRIWPPTGKEEKKQYAVDGLALAKKEVATLAIRVSTAGAEVLIDDRSVGRAPLDREVFVEAGAHTIEAKLAGFEVSSGSVSASSSSSSGTGTGGSGGAPAGCVPSESADPVADGCGVFVSSSLGTDGNGGVKAAPEKTIGKAIEKAKSKGGRVYACAEAFAEAVTISDGVTIYGRLDCTSGWAYIGATKKTSITADADAIPLTVMSTASGTEIYDLAITAADATKDGGSSIALLDDGAELLLERMDLTAGAGKAGTPGAAQSKVMTPARLRTARALPAVSAKIWI